MVFRRQAVSEEELIQFSEHFGEVVPHTRPDWASPTAREITIVSNMKNADGVGTGGLGTGELAWHTDQSFVPYPATGCLLCAVELPPDNPDTSWANLLQAYEGMPDALKKTRREKTASSTTCSGSATTTKGTSRRKKSVNVCHRSNMLSSTAISSLAKISLSRSRHDDRHRRFGERSRTGVAGRINRRRNPTRICLHPQMANRRCCDVG